MQENFKLERFCYTTSN